MKQKGHIREHVIRVLLNDPEGKLTKYMAAKKAEGSFPWVHEFLKRLESRGLVKGTEVTDYAGLVAYWRTLKIKPDRREYMHKDPLGVLRETKLRYALTTYQADNLVQHYLFPSRTDLYVSEKDMNRWQELLTGEGLAGKGNVRLLVLDDHVFYKSFERDGLNLVSLPQLIVDLFEEGGAGVEAAEKLLDKVTASAL